MAIPSFHRPIIKKAYQRFSPLIKSKKTASYFTLTLSLFSLSFFGLFAIRPTLITATSLIQSVSDLKQLNQDYENKISNIIRVQSEYEQIRKDLPLIYKAVPTSSMFSKLVIAVEKFSKEQNITLTQFQVDPVPISKPANSDKPYTFGFTLGASGDFTSLSLFLQHLLNWQRLVTLNSLDFSKEIATGDILRMTIKGVLYYEP